MDKTYYILYQVTNNLNGKIYVGVHKTKKLDDGYMGSGKVITSAIAKYGIENFTRVILEQFENSAAMYAREKEVVTDEFLLREDTYNLRRGGFGGFDYINAHQLYGFSDSAVARKGRLTVNKKLVKQHQEKLANDEEYRARWLAQVRANPSYGFAGKTHSEETKQKMRKPKGLGDKNSQFGKQWITNGVDSVMLLKTHPIPEGWRKGRVIRQ